MKPLSTIIFIVFNFKRKLFSIIDKKFTYFYFYEQNYHFKKKRALI